MEALIPDQLVTLVTDQMEGEQLRERFRNTVSQLSALPGKQGTLSELLTSYGHLVADLFAANTVAIWFRASSGEALRRRVEIGWEHLALDGSVSAAHELLVGYALREEQPLSIPPFTTPHAGSGVSNPTDSHLLLVPVRYGSERVAVLEVGLGPMPLRRPHEELATKYLQWLGWLAAVLESCIRESFSQVGNDLQEALSCLDLAAQEVATLQERIRQTLQQALRRLAGRNFGSLAANRDIAKRVHEMLDGKGLRVKCPECGAAAILRCQKAGNSKTGAFVFDHYLDTGRTFHGGPRSFPVVELVQKPPRRRS